MTRKPNFLFVQADQMTSRALSVYGNRVAQTPNIDRLAQQGVVFEHAYCNYPLCGPSRFSMLSGLLPSKAGAYDNGAEFPASLPTFVHYLRLLGYQTSLTGKMHFIGPDQLHGFEERLTTDIYPADFNWTADWADSAARTGVTRLLAAAGEVNGIRESGIYKRTIQLDYDNEVAVTARQKIRELGHADDERPFCLFVSFTHPHDPFAVPREYWDRYRHEDIDMPSIPKMPPEQLDAHSRRLYDHIGVAEADMSDAEVRVARHAYYGAISYIDDQLGSLLDVLDEAELSENTVVIFLSDHGEALGERGLWFKRSLFDCALQVPLIISAPWLFAPGRCDENVSLVDLFPTVVDIADPENGLGSIETDYDGHSLRELLLDKSDTEPELVIAELMGEAMDAPAVMVMEGSYKYIYCESDPAQLYDRSVDALEQNNLAGLAEFAEIESRLAAVVMDGWDLTELKGRVRMSQLRRRLVDRSHAVGQTPAWDYEPETAGQALHFRSCAANPSASNYNSTFKVRARPDSDLPNKREYP